MTSTKLPPTLPNWTARQVVVGTLVVVAVAAAFWLIVQLQAVIFSLIVAIVISTAITPAVEWLHARGLSRALGVAVIYLGLLGLWGMVAWLVLPLIAEQGAALANLLGSVYLQAVNTLRLSPSRLIRRLAWQLPGDVPVSAATGTTDGGSLDAVAQAMQLLGQAGEVVFVIIAVLLLAFYWTLERERIQRSLLLLLPPNGRDNLRDLAARAERKVGDYVRGVALLSLIVGALALVVFVLLGMPNALLLAVIVGVFEAVPIVGPALGTLVAVLVALASDPSQIIWIILGMSIIQFLENTFLVPRVMGHTVGVNPVVTLLALVAFGTAFGLPGALLAIPLAAVMQLLLDQFVFNRPQPDSEENYGRDRLSRLRVQAQDLIADVRKQLREKTLEVDDEDRVEDAIEALATDIDSVLARYTEERGTGP